MWNADLVAKLEAERARLHRKPIWAPATREEIAELVEAVKGADSNESRRRRRLRAVS